MITLAIRSGYAELLDGEQPTGVRWKLDGDAAAGVRSFGDRYSDALGIEGPNAVARRRRELLDIGRELWSWEDSNNPRNPRRQVPESMRAAQIPTRGALEGVPAALSNPHRRIRAPLVSAGHETMPSHPQFPLKPTTEPTCRLTCSTPGPPRLPTIAHSFSPSPAESEGGSVSPGQIPHD